MDKGFCIGVKRRTREETVERPVGRGGRPGGPARGAETRPGDQDHQGHTVIKVNPKRGVGKLKITR